MKNEFVLEGIFQRINVDIKGQFTIGSIIIKQTGQKKDKYYEIKTFSVTDINYLKNLDQGTPISIAGYISSNEYKDKIYTSLVAKQYRAEEEKQTELIPGFETEGDIPF